MKKKERKRSLEGEREEQSLTFTHK
jgi:hypothetical protein